MKQRQLTLLIGILVLWPALSFWSQRRDHDNNKEEPTKDEQDQGLRIDVSAVPGATITLPNGFFASSNLDDLLDKLSTDFILSRDTWYVVEAQTALEFESFTFMAESLSIDNGLIDSFLSIPDYQVYMLGYSEPVASVSAAKEEQEPVAWYQDYAYLLWGAIAIVAGTAVYRLHDELSKESSDTITISGDIAATVEEDEAAGEIVKSGQLIAADNQGALIAFDPDSVISEENSLGQLTVTKEGLWIFTVDNDQIQFLAADEVLEQVFTVVTITGLKQEITVQISGLNDAPELDDITRSVKQADEAFIIDLLVESNATDIDGDALSLVVESISLIDENVDAAGVIFDAATNSLRVNPAYYSHLGNDETITISYNFSVTDGFVEISKIVKVMIIGDEPPTVDIVINEIIIDNVAIIKSASSSVSFVFSEAVADFTSSDITLSLGRIENLRQDAVDNQVWHADLNLTAADIAAWQYGQVAEIAIDVNRFTDINGNFNAVGAVANYLVIVDRNLIIEDAIAVIDNFIHPKAYYSDTNPNLLFEGTEGNDYIDAFNGDNIIYGFAGDDILVAAGGDDVFIGGAGNDLFIDSAGDDVYVGGAGNDILLLNLGGQQQDIFIGGAGFDRVVVPGSLQDYNLSLASKERIDFTNEYLTRSLFDTADVRDILLKLAESSVEPINPFIELALTSFAVDGFLSMTERLEFAANYGDAAAELLWELPSFRGIKAKDIEGFDTAIPVIELTTKADMAAADISTYLANLLQAEMLIFDDGIVHILDGVITTEATGTEGADLFFLALPTQINEQIELTYTLNYFALGEDTIVIEGLFLKGDNDDVTEVELETLLEYLKLDETGESGQIDLSSFVDSDGNSVSGQIIVKFVPATETSSIDDSNTNTFSIFKPDDDFPAVISGDF